jgi:hypothetical protein
MKPLFDRGRKGGNEHSGGGAPTGGEDDDDDLEMMGPGSGNSGEEEGEGVVESAPATSRRWHCLSGPPDAITSRRRRRGGGGIAAAAAAGPTPIAILVVAIGAASGAVILGLGVTAAERDQESRFAGASGDLLHELEEALSNFEVAGLWLHQACRRRRRNTKQGQQQQQQQQGEVTGITHESTRTSAKRMSTCYQRDSSSATSRSP